MPDGNGEEHRVDTESRKRVVQMEQRLRSITRKLLWMVGLLGIGVVAGFIGVGCNAAALKDSRREASEQACKTRNEDRSNIRKYVVSQSSQQIPTDSAEFLRMPQSVQDYFNAIVGQIDPDAIETAVNDAFPIEPDCKAYAERAVE